MGDIIDAWRLRKGWYWPQIREVAEDAIHVTANGQRLLVTHGDLFDAVMQHASRLAHLGSWLYELLLKLNRWMNAVRLRLGLPYWSMSQFVKHQVKDAVNFISQFENAMAAEARRRGCDGVVSGHIDKADIRDIDGVLYCNGGDWVESMTARLKRLPASWKSFIGVRGKRSSSIWVASIRCKTLLPERGVST